MTNDLREKAEAATPDMRDTALVVAKLRKLAPRDQVDTDGLLIRAADLLAAKDAELTALRAKVKAQAEEIARLEANEKFAAEQYLKLASTVSRRAAAAYNSQEPKE